MNSCSLHALAVPCNDRPEKPGALLQVCIVQGMKQVAPLVSAQQAAWL
jgi:hypothetical protein